MSNITRRTAILGTTALAFSSPFIRQSKAAVPITFRLDWSIYGSHAPFFLALEDKMFEKAGLDVSIGEGQGSATVAKIVGQGNDPIGFIDFTSMIRAIEQGIPLIALQRVISNVMCVISNADEPIRSPKELEGKVIAYAPSESTAQMMPALLQQAGADGTKINVLNPAFGAKNALFLQKRADAIPGNVNVQVAQLEGQGAKLSYFLFSDFGVEMMNNGIVANADWLQKNPEAAKSFVRITAEAYKAAKENPEKAVDLLIKRLPQQARNKALLLRQLDLTFPSLQTKSTKDKAFGVMTEDDWRGTQDLLLKYGGLGKQVQLEKLYTNKFLEA